MVQMENFQKPKLSIYNEIADRLKNQQQTWAKVVGATGRAWTGNVWDYICKCHSDLGSNSYI
jgi:hypothetical protein